MSLCQSPPVDKLYQRTPAQDHFNCLRCGAEHHIDTGCSVQTKPHLSFDKLNEAIGFMDKIPCDGIRPFQNIEDDYKRVNNQEPVLHLIQELQQEIKHIHRRINGLSELRHETNQNEGCTRAKVENDILPALSVIQHQLQKIWDDFGKVHDNFVNRILKLEQYMQIENRITASDVLLRLNELERFQSITNQQYLKLTGRNESPEIKTEDLSFGEAVALLKLGKLITRACWRNKKIYVYLRFAKENEAGFPERAEELRVMTIRGIDCVWSPNHDELLGNDWRVV